MSILFFKGIPEAAPLFVGGSPHLLQRSSSLGSA